MAANTEKSLRNQVMYQIFVRNFSEEGTFAAVKEQLGRIKALGVDIIWFMPIHPIGKEKRKGSLGSPYAISDYRAVNPEFGTLDDFRELVEAIHAHGMRCIIDVVYNHTSPDSVLRHEHPEWFYHRPDGSFGNRVGDWSDIIDLDYSHKELWDYQAETLKYWVELVDGFRCDVAPLIPLKFWQYARWEVRTVRPDCIWLSESIEPGFILHMRDRGLTALSDSEIFQAFDLSYDYDCYNAFTSYIDGSGTLSDYAKALNMQEYIYPDNYVKLRFLENHDQTRAHFLIPDIQSLQSWTAFLFFQKGMTLIYNGQEFAASHLPSLFDKDTIDMKPVEADLSCLISRLSEMKKEALLTDSTYQVKAVSESILVATHSRNESKLVGIFPLKCVSAFVRVPLNDGVYTNLIDGSKTEVFRGGVQCFGKPVILKY